MSNKAKRHITEFDFESEGSLVSLVSKHQGGPANGRKTLIMKSKATKTLPEVKEVDLTKKLEQIKVTMSMEEFLRKFFDIWSDDAELLTAMMGFQTEYEAYMESEESEPMDHAGYIASKLSGFELMKSMHEGKEFNSSASDIVDILELQEKLEPKFKEEMMDISKARLTELEASETKLEEQVEISKSLQSKVEELTAELETIRKAQEEAEFTAMKGRLEGVVAEEKLDRMTKSLLAMDKEDADALIESLTSQAKAKEDADKDLFVEKSASGEPEIKTETQTKDLQMQKALNEAFGIKE